ncbi:MAG: sugar transferase, partial [Clostridia bacterium]|nr:sugar transferase [Clostridia bacterium]
RIENVYEYTNIYPEFDLRHRVKAGLTGFAQLYGKYNTSPQDKLNMDLTYIETYSILKDLKLLILTVKVLFMKESTEGFDKKANESVKKPDIKINTGDGNNEI